MFKQQIAKAKKKIIESLKSIQSPDEERVTSQISLESFKERIYESAADCIYNQSINFIQIEQQIDKAKNGELIDSNLRYDLQVIHNLMNNKEFIAKVIFKTEISDKESEIYKSYAKKFYPEVWEFAKNTYLNSENAKQNPTSSVGQSSWDKVARQRTSEPGK